MPVIDFLNAATEGDIDTLEELWSGPQMFPIGTIECAASVGHIDCVKYLINKNCLMNHNLMTCAVDSGNMELIKYLHYDLHVYYSSDCYHVGVRKGHVSAIKEVMSWNNVVINGKSNPDFYEAFAEDNVKGKKAVKEAYELGNMEGIQFLFDKGIKWVEKYLK